ncbi:hypothetical protein F6R98_02720 [Candidatus Methylospira mobilis]|uniref:Cysteine rich repeat protein n=1 Tax=Candidatus Methylospira mobilis TaxID=1808979 RepID=A0A5Q0BHI9_9GAMM|nr:cysteine rich repeat-containing protein [Candidatus Methylospira mobilis]QFY41671.1 hypothetical protein F6R98_02720 [Candidatus Methylospira mobilis]WNV06522.1 cysteine rich repeat-containing protein [Candidatus Methylospira mobilis]
MIFRAIVISLAVSAPASAFAQESAPDTEMQALRKYCEPDIKRLCPAVQPGQGRIKACLMQHKQEMSVGCAMALKELKKK